MLLFGIIIIRYGLPFILLYMWKNMDSMLLGKEKWVWLHKSESSRQNLEDDKKALQDVCANCEDFERVVERKDGWCVKCEIFKALAYIDKEIAGL